MTKSLVNMWGIAVAVMMVVLGNGKGAMAIEKAKYEVLEKEAKIELRQYEPRIVAETFVEGDFEKVGSEGFRRLYDYISGNNRKKLSIAMTAPVTQEGESQKIAMTAPVNQVRAGNQWRITFIMPSEFALDDLPVPVDDRVGITQESAHPVKIKSEIFPLFFLSITSKKIIPAELIIAQTEGSVIMKTPSAMSLI